MFDADDVHRKATVIDFHCDTIGRFMAGEDLRRDLPSGHVDIPKLKRGGVDLEIFACYVSAPRCDSEKSQAAKRAFDLIDAVHRLGAGNPSDLEVIETSEDIARLRNSGKTAILIGIEGGYAIENDLSLLRAFYRSGVRLMTLTHWTRTDWADASGDPKPDLGGLTEFGEHVVKEMNRLGMIIDVSHAHDETFWDVLRVSAAPVVASHSCCRALSDHHRNLSDDMLRALAKNGGVVGINFSPGFLNVEVGLRQGALFSALARKHGVPDDFTRLESVEPGKREAFLAELRQEGADLLKTLPPVTVGTLIDHVDHVIKVTGGADHVGLGSDFDGISSTPAGLENIGAIPNISRELLVRGYGQEDIYKILGGNFIRVFETVERTVARTP